MNEQQEIRKLVADVINDNLKINELPSGRKYFLVQKTLYKMNRIELVKEMARVATRRLEEKGYIFLPQGSLFSMIKKEYFEKALEKEIIVKSHGIYKANRQKLSEIRGFLDDYKKHLEEEKRFQQLKTEYDD